uniref:Uncharacterized protein n=1 Tax=Caenorhabditis japonica TaxID=281687 RepID=A0A8R1E7A7_CAEJA
MKFPDEHISKVSMFVANSITVPRRTDEEEQFEIEKLPFIVPELIRAELLSIFKNASTTEKKKSSAQT